jgi:hypothetical protein
MGQIAKITAFGPIPTLDPRQSLSLPQTQRHWGKHIHAMRRPAAIDLRLQAREIRNDVFGIHEEPVDPETGRTSSTPPAPVAQPASVQKGRPAAIHATRQRKVARDPAADRLAELDRARAALKAQIAASEAVAALISEHGVEAVHKALKEVA